MMRQEEEEEEEEQEEGKEEDEEEKEEEEKEEEEGKEEDEEEEEEEEEEQEEGKEEDEEEEEEEEEEEKEEEEGKEEEEEGKTCDCFGDAGLGWWFLRPKQQVPSTEFQLMHLQDPSAADAEVVGTNEFDVRIGGKKGERDFCFYASVTKNHSLTWFPTGSGSF
uniref:Uncharacterized protein n=1 Tax=Knipowitschia caucasica TaxID=637954 RepID=A0AAV2J6G4_KNICA